MSQIEICDREQSICYDYTASGSVALTSDLSTHPWSMQVKVSKVVVAVATSG